MASEMGLAEISALSDAGNDFLLTEDERAQLPKKPLKPANSFNANLAESLDATALAKLAGDVYDGYIADDASRKAWREREKLGIQLLGLSDSNELTPAFEGGSEVIHPGLIEAIIQFQARAISELWPPEGPAKALVEGQAFNPQREMQAQRVAGYINWLCISRMPGGYQHHDRMLFRLPLSGSVFKKIAYDAIAGCLVSRFVPAEELVVPYGATDLETAPRVTHVISYTGHDVERLIESGVYRETSLSPCATDTQKTDLQPVIDSVSGSEPIDIEIESSGRYVFLEQSILATLPGDPPNSPYLVTIERDSQAVFAVYRDWRQKDQRRKRRARYTHYYFLPGLDGFYGTGLLHVLGKLAHALTGNLRALLDAGLLANLQGGFRAANVRLPGGKRDDGISIKPGEWQPLEATAEELQKLFFQVPYKEPSQTLLNLLTYLDELLRRVAGTTGELVGQETKNVPVGTTLARIEQGLKVQNAIHIRLHQAQAHELALLVQLTADTLPDAEYCRDVLSVEPAVFANEFDARVDVRPVSNPNAMTATQRIVIAQAIAERAAQAPDLYDRRAVEKRLLETMRADGVDELLPARSQVQRMGPVEENMALVMAQPVKSQPDQDHAAHIIVHQDWLHSLADQDLKKRVEAAAIAHIAEHHAWIYFLQMQQALGMPISAATLGSGQPTDPKTENMLARMSANAVQLMRDQQATAPDPALMQQDHRANLESAKTAAEIRRKDALAASQIQMNETQLIARMNRDVAEQEARLAAQFVSDQAKTTLGQAPA